MGPWAPLTRFLEGFVWHTSLRPRTMAPQVFMLHKEADSLSANATWVLENATPNYGGSVEFGKAYRLRHLPSSSYLTAQGKANSKRKLQLGLSAHPSSSTSADSLFVLLPLDADTVTLDSTTPVQLVHEPSGMYVKRPQTARHPLKTDQGAQSPAPPPPIPCPPPAPPPPPHAAPEHPLKPYPLPHCPCVVAPPCQWHDARCTIGRSQSGTAAPAAALPSLASGYTLGPAR